ncbi:MAG: EamA family transporter [Cuspidothrix sp.]
MGRFEKRPENPGIRGELSKAAENALWDVLEDLEKLQQNLLRSLQEDVKRLETEKNRLSNDIQKLIEEKEQLQQSRQITEQQVLIRQLAEVLAKHISSQLQSSLKTLATQAVEENLSDQSPLEEDPTPEVISLPYSETTTEDKSPEITVFSEPEITTEDPTPPFWAVLTSQALAAPSLAETETKPEPRLVDTANVPTGKRPAPKLRQEGTSKQEKIPTTPRQETTPNQPIPSRPDTTVRKQITSRQPRSRTSTNWSHLQTGFLLICLSTVVSSLYNVAIKAIFYTASNPGGLPTQQLIFPTLGNIFLILMLRLLVVVPLMLLLSPILYPPIWQELENLFAGLRANATPGQKKTKQGLFLSIISGGLLFLSQVLIYVALGDVSTGMAIALFFIYPVMSVFLSWFLFQERPNLFVTGAMAAIFCGELLVLAGQTVELNNTSLGSITAVMSGIVFAMYVIFTRICDTKLKLHPVSLTLIHFTTMLLLSFICLIIPLPGNLGLAISSSNILELILSALILGVLTLCGYLFNNFGIRKLGSPISSFIGATVPVVTVIFAGFMLQESLQVVQIMGIMLITVGAAILSRKKTPNQPQAAK